MYPERAKSGQIAKIQMFFLNTKSGNIFASIGYKLIDKCYFFNELPKHLT